MSSVCVVVMLFNVAIRQMAIHVNPVASLQPLTQDSPVRTGSGFLNCTSCTCVKLREKRECFSTIQHCSCVNNLVIIIHLSVFVCLYLCLCMFVHSVFLACLVILCTIKEQVVLLFLFVCFCVLWVLLSPAFPHLAIYSKVSFSAGLQGNDTEDYCLDQ